MKLESVSLHDVRAVGNLDIDLSRSLASGVPFFITGSAGSGKTTVLEAIAAAKEAAAPYGLPPMRSAFRELGRSPGRVVLRWRSPADAQSVAPPDLVTTTWALDEGVPNDSLQAPRLRRTLGDYSRDATRFKVEYFHTARSFDPEDQLTVLPTDSAAGTRRLVRDARKYSWIRRYLADRGADDAAATHASVAGAGAVFASSRPGADSGFARMLTLITDRVRWLVARRQAGMWTCMFGVENRGEVELGQLSDSERMLVLFAAAIDALGLDRSLLLIDLPELMLHPEDHLAFVSGLATAMPSAQIVAATSSPAILRSVAPGCVLVLKRCCRDGGVPTP